MPGFIRRDGRGSVFTLSSLRSWTHPIPPNSIHRSATDPLLNSIPYHEHKAPTEQVQQSTKLAPQSFLMRLRAATEKTSAKLKSLALKRPAKSYENLPDTGLKQDQAVSSQSFSSKRREEGMEDKPLLRATKSTPDVSQSRVHPLRWHEDVLAMAQRPIHTISAVPQVKVDREAENMVDEDREIYLEGLHDAVIYSPSIGTLNSYTQQVPSPARSPYESTTSTRDKDRLCADHITHALTNATNGSKNFNSMARSMASLNQRGNMSGLFNNATAYQKLAEPQEKGFEQVGTPKLLRDVDSGSLSQPQTPAKHEYSTNGEGKQHLLTPASKSSASIHTPHYMSEKTPLADESPQQHTPIKPSPLRRVYASGSLGAMEHEQVEQWI